MITSKQVKGTFLVHPHFGDNVDPPQKAVTKDNEDQQPFARCFRLCFCPVPSPLSRGRDTDPGAYPNSGSHIFSAPYKKRNSLRAPSLICMRGRAMQMLHKSFRPPFMPDRGKGGPFCAGDGKKLRS